MAESKQIKSSEIIQPNLFGNTIKSAKELSDTLAVLKVGFEDIIKLQSKILKETKINNADSIRKVTKAMQEQAKTTEALNVVKEQQAKLDADQIAKNQIARKDMQDLIKLKKAEQILLDKTRGELEKLNAANTVLRLSREKLIKTDKDYEKNLKAINTKIDENNDKILLMSDRLKKAKMNVGNYSESIKEALGNTGLFNGTLGNIVNQLKQVADDFKNAESGAKKLGTALKGIAAIGIVGIITTLVSVMKANQNVIDAFAVGWAKIKDAVLGTNFEGAVKATQALRRDIRILNDDLQTLVLDAEDFKEISEDTTRSYQEREAALLKFQETRLKASEKALEIARRELEVAEENLVAGAAAGMVTNDLADARAAAALKVKAAEDDVADSARISAMENRKLKADAITQEVELIRSKKKSSTQQIEILKQQIADEKRQIEEREQSLKEFNRINMETYRAQIKAIEDGTGTQIDEMDLLRETDNKIFAEKIRNLGLGEQLTSLLATAVKKAQEAEQSGSEQQAKLDEDKIKRLNTIKSIQRDIEKARREDAENDLELARKLNEQEKARAMTEVQNNRFDREKMDNLKEILGAEKTLTEDFYQRRAGNLKKQMEADKEAAEIEIADLEVRKAKMIQIEEQYLIDVGNLEAEAEAELNQLKLQQQDVFEDLEKARTQSILGSMADVTNQLGQELDRRAQMQQEYYDNELEMRKENIGRQAELAAQGADNQLAFEKAQLAKSELEKKDAAERARKQREAVILTEAFFNAYNAKLSQDGANSAQAAQEAFAEVLAAKGLSKVFQYAAEGNDMIEGPGTETSDSIPFMLSKHEAVIKASENKKHNDAVRALNAGTFSDMYIPRESFNEVASKVKQAEIQANRMLLEEYKQQTSLLKKIADKPVQQIDVDKFGNIIENVYKNGQKISITHKFGRI